ncbi:hypothetical protein ESCAB7627_3490 [Escherichia albertii TW07627]|uniref:Uncharacterized protein n=1 Tax=Escherichia albertii (strain TW07627) TaxID=502347 RepID=A0ABC9NK99_ESCAT|nr:hypothetical protein ESCAB7627_3490 [Escherichia albertii TW07627]
MMQAPLLHYSPQTKSIINGQPLITVRIKDSRSDNRAVQTTS